MVTFTLFNINVFPCPWTDAALLLVQTQRCLDSILWREINSRWTRLNSRGIHGGPTFYCKHRRCCAGLGPAEIQHSVSEQLLTRTAKKAPLRKKKKVGTGT